jgi:transcriptional regulator with XRE-family HTH domain
MRVDYGLLGKRIAQKRRNLGLTQVQVNEKAELSDKYLSNIETARSIPSIDVLMKICDALAVTPDYLLIGTLINENSEISDKIIDKIKSLSEKKLKMLDNFTEWLTEYEAD